MLENTAMKNNTALSILLRIGNPFLLCRLKVLRAFNEFLLKSVNVSYCRLSYRYSQSRIS